MAHVGLSAGETDVLGAGYVLDEVHVVHVAVLLVHALAGRPLPLEVAPLRRAWLTHTGGALLTQSGKGCRVVHAINRWPMFVWGLTLFSLSSSLFRTGCRQELKLTWKEQTLRHRAICLVLVRLRVYPTHSWLLETPA